MGGKLAKNHRTVLPSSIGKMEGWRTAEHSVRMQQQDMYKQATRQKLYGGQQQFGGMAQQQFNGNAGQQQFGGQASGQQQFGGQQQFRGQQQFGGQQQFRGNNQFGRYF